MSVPAQALALGRRWEGLHKLALLKETYRVVPYLCPALVWTVGFGHTGQDVVQGLEWTKEQAEEALQADMALAYAQALALCPVLVQASEGRQAAITDFVFNLGSGRLKASTLHHRINAGQWDLVPAELRKWVFGGGRKLPGLILRREAEIALL